MPTTELIFDVELFVAAGLALALATIWLRRDLRRNMIGMAIAMGMGLIGLTLLARFGSALSDATILAVARETALLLVAIGFTRIAVMFAFQGVLARLAIPRILADVLIAVVLIVFGIIRMKEVGVNLAGIITTSAVITGVIAFSLQETLGNLWGGIALQLDNTCRIGDWIRMEGVSGQVVGIRWRYTSIATNNGETVIIPNGQLIKTRVTVLGRRGDERIPWRRDVEFAVAYDVPPSRVLAAVKDALAHAEIRNVAATPPLIIACMGFGDNGIHYAVRYWLTDLRARRLDRLAGPPARRGDARAAPHGDPVPAPGADRAQRAGRAGAARTRSRRAERHAVADRALRRADGRRAARARGRACRTAPTSTTTSSRGRARRRIRSSCWRGAASPCTTTAPAAPVRGITWPPSTRRRISAKWAC